jgi:Cysteine-rich CWC
MNLDVEAPVKGSRLECEKCHTFFNCRADDIAACHCSAVKLSKAQMDRIAARWNGCLCRDCLVEIAQSEPG